MPQDAIAIGEAAMLPRQSLGFEVECQMPWRFRRSSLSRRSLPHAAPDTCLHLHFMLRLAQEQYGPLFVGLWVTMGGQWILVPRRTGMRGGTY